MFKQTSRVKRLTLKSLLLVSGLTATLLAVTNVSANKTPTLLPSILKGYQLQGKPLSIQGLKDNASGLTYSPVTNTLFMVVNNPETLYELSLSGEVLRMIILQGFEDTEGVAHIEGNRFAVLEERRSEINFIDINPETLVVKKSDSDRFALNIFTSSEKNLRLEGISIDHSTGDIYLVKEKSPRALYKVSGLLDGKNNVQVSTPWNLEDDNNGSSDLSGLFFAPEQQRLLVLSDESSKLTEFSLDGKPISEIRLSSFWQAQHKNIPQAEGVAVSADGTLYIVSEPNLLYRFVNTTAKTASPSRG